TASPSEVADSKKSQPKQPTAPEQQQTLTKVIATVRKRGDVNQAAQQNDGNTGKERLTAEEQKLVDNFHPQDFENFSPFLQDARSRYEASKNSGLQPPFANVTSRDTTKLKEGKEKAKELITSNTTVPERGRKDFTDAPGLHTNIRDQFN